MNLRPLLLPFAALALGAVVLTGCGGGGGRRGSGITRPGTSTGNLVLSGPTGGYNGSTDNLDALGILDGLLRPDGFFADGDITVNGLTRSLSISLAQSGGVSAGDRFTVDGENDRFVLYRETDVQGSTTLNRAFESASGTVTVVSIEGDRAVLRLENVRLVSNPVLGSNAVGEITLNGTVTTTVRIPI